MAYRYDNNSADKFITFLKKKKTYIFDMDGVLFDSSIVHEKAFLGTLKKIPLWFNYNEYSGMSTAEALSSFLSNKKLINFLTIKKKELSLKYLSSVKIYPYVKKTLQLLKNKGINLVLATSGSKKRVMRLLRFMKLDGYFNVILAAEDVKRSKPFPDIYMKASVGLGTNKDETVVIEDAPNGISAAKKAGIETIALLHNYPAKELVSADFLCRDIYSLYSLINYCHYQQKFEITDKNRNRKKVTVIMPAAGIGLRLPFDRPKLLYPILGKPVLHYLYGILKQFSDKIIIVANSKGAGFIRKYVSENGIDAEVVIVENSAGTADSVLSARENCLGSRDVLVIWGDQLGIKEESLDILITTHKQNNAHLSMPTVLRREPYIHFIRNEEGMIVDVLRRRFNHEMPEYGENDSGVFLVNKDIMFSILGKMKSNYLKYTHNLGNPIREFDFLDIIPQFAKRGYKIITASCISSNETVGMNDLSEVKFHEKRFRLKNNIL